MDTILQIMDSPVFAYAILPLLIFCSRIVDVSVGTMRIIFVSRRRRSLPPSWAFLSP